MASTAPGGPQRCWNHDDCVYDAELGEACCQYTLEALKRSLPIGQRVRYSTEIRFTERDDMGWKKWSTRVETGEGVVIGHNLWPHYLRVRPDKLPPLDDQLVLSVRTWTFEPINEGG